MVRPAARVLCLDPYQRLLLLRWRDPVDAAMFWAPPGGALAPGEDHLAAVRRELSEGTGLPAHAVTGRSVFAGTERFFLARTAAPYEVSPLLLTAATDGSLVEGRWLAWEEVLALDEPVRPPHLADVLTALDPSGPWNPEPPWGAAPGADHKPGTSTAA